MHVAAAGVATWTELTVPGAASTSGNSIYEDKAIGIFVQGGIVRAYIATVPGLYNPVTNTGTLIASTNGATALSATNGDDVVNSGTIVASAPNSTGIASGTFGVIQNRGTAVASGAGSTAVQLNGTFGSFINTGLLSATSGAFALATGATAVGPTIVNSGIIDGQVAVAGGPFTRFQNSGRMGISAAGSGVTHTTSGVYRPDLVRHPGAARRSDDVGQPAGQRRGAVERHGAGELPAGHARQELHPGHDHGRLHRHVQHAGHRRTCRPSSMPA